MNRRSVSLDTDQYAQLKSYSDVTGRPMRDLIEEAVHNYLEVDVEAFYEVLQARAATT